MRDQEENGVIGDCGNFLETWECVAAIFLVLLEDALASIWILVLLSCKNMVHVDRAVKADVVTTAILSAL